MFHQLGHGHRANRDLDCQKHDGGLEIHVPREFSLAEPAIAFTHKSLMEMSIKSHPVAKQLPRRMDAPFTQSLPASSDFRTLQVRDGFPTSLDAMIESGQPQLSLHIHSFKDATVVGLAWPHTLMDGVARANLMRNWSLVVAGQEDKIDQIVGARRDVLVELMTDVSDPGEEDVFDETQQQLKGFQLAQFASQWAWERLAGSPKHWRAMYVPAAIYDTLVGKVKSEANDMGPLSDRKMFIGEADAIVAAVAQKVALAEPKPRPLTIMTLFNCQCRIEKLRLCEGIFAQNMILLAYTLLSAHEARDTAAAIAINHRQHMIQQTTRSQIVHSLRRLCNEVKAGNQLLPLRGQANSLMLAVNSMMKLDLITGINFSAAVVREGDNQNARSNPPGTMVNFFFKEVNESMPYLNSFTCLGRDHAGGAWFVGYLSSWVWDALEQDLKALS